VNYTPLQIDSLFLEENSNQEIETQLKNSNGYGIFIFNFPMCRSHSDIAEYYLDVAFIGQLLHSLDSRVSYTESSDDCYGSIYAFSFHVHSYEKFEENFEILRQLLNEESLDPVEEREDFRDILGVHRVAFPDLIDFYYANVLGSNYDWEDEYRDELYLEHPEWAYHCWLSARSPECGYPLYVSPKFWLMPAGVDFKTALNFVSDIDVNEISMESVQNRFTIEEGICLLGAGKTAVISELLHQQILEIASIVFPVEYDPGSSRWSRLPAVHRFSISCNMDFLICGGDTFTYILFREDFSFATTKQLAGIRKHVEKLFKGLSFQAELLLEYKCNWALLNDESFELVCYDLARRDGRFVSSKVKKMGLAKSRDGGRDILAYTPARPGATPQKWLIQCKHSLAKKTLGRNSIQLAELISEYSPAGVIIATNLIVDAELHDKAESIAQNLGAEIEMWDALELERRLNRNTDLYKLYFEGKA
jgi:hypothetical protein